MSERQRPNLRARLASKELLVAPGVFDGISAKIADQMGFEALDMTGYGTVASHLGLPDAGIRHLQRHGRARGRHRQRKPKCRHCRRRYRLRRIAQRSTYGERL